MKNLIILSCIAIALLGSCVNNNSEKCEEVASQECSKDCRFEQLTREEIKMRLFDELFDSIDVKDIKEDVFTLVGEDYGILTAGTPDNFNSMVTSWGGWGIVFGKPGVFHFLRSNRYTLEFMREQKTYTVSFFRMSSRMISCFLV